MWLAAAFFDAGGEPKRKFALFAAPGGDIPSPDMADLLDIVGQEVAISQLARIVASGRRPGAYLFAGPTGVGRRTTAEALANTLLCQRPLARKLQGRMAEFPEDLTVPGVCGECPDCLALAAGTHADYHAVSRQTARYSEDPDVRSRVMQNVSVQVVREFIIAPASRRSARGRGKVFVVRQAEQMSDAAQNALLKTLEEPPPGVSLILICRSPDELLATTRSRCALVRFGPLPADFVIDRLIGEGVAPEQARFWASYTERSVGRALRLAKAGLYETKRELVDRLAALTDKADPQLGDWLVGQAEALAAAAVAEDKKLARTLATRQGAGLLLGLLASVYQDATARAGGSDRSPIHADQSDRICGIADALGAVVAADIVTQLTRCEQLLWRNVNAKTLWDNVVITCASGAPLDV